MGTVNDSTPTVDALEAHRILADMYGRQGGELAAWRAKCAALQREVASLKQQLEASGDEGEPGDDD